jgi:phosphinothricin acetyltransferase
MPALIRAALAKDIPAINRIYGHYVETCTCTWEEHEKELLSTKALERRNPRHPLLVAEVEGEVVAWGALSAYSLRSGWHPTVEDSIFVHAKHQGKGLGRQMLTALVDQAQLLKYQSVIARISGDQPASLGLHHTLGFKEVGRIHAAGKKFGQQLDCVYLQLQLAEPKP